MPGYKMRSGVLVFWSAAVLLAAGAAVLFSLHLYQSRVAAIRIQGAVIRMDSDTRKQQPIGDVSVILSDGATAVITQSDPSGYFKLELKKQVWPGQTLRLTFRHADYKTVELTVQTGVHSTKNDLFVVPMTPIFASVPGGTVSAPRLVSNIRVRYTINAEQQVNIGSAVRTFQVVNQANVPCERQSPCSPDGRWKAASGSESMDAGAGNQFGNVRASCIAGPCPFTRIDASGFMHGGRNIRVTALNWSDTATFLLQAEVLQTTITSNVRESYPVIFGQALNFTLPPTQEGASIEAEIDGAPMVFPLGPDLYLSWANCTARTNAEEEKSTVYSCALKPGYRF